ncbi:MAG: hypothetical protein GXY89_04895 [Tissierellia bacterium]|nr:hypothetical protein [Tissierellia bacterium]
MSRKRNSKSDMKQVYLIRRVVAVLIIVLILVFIFTRCSNKKNIEEENVNNNTNTTQTTNNEPSVPNVVNGVNDEDNLNAPPTDIETEPETTEDEGTDAQDVIATNEKNIQNQYDEHANTEYRDGAFYLNFKGDTRTMVTSRLEDEHKENFNEFWESFKYDLIKTSETLAETVEPGIELHVIDPKDDRSTLLLIKDGSVLFDSTEI